MNKIELNEQLRGNPKWERFAAELSKAMMEEFSLEGVSVALRELSKEERLNEEHEVLTFNHERQQFEFAMGSADHFPAAWKVAGRIDQFLNPVIDAEE